MSAARLLAWGAVGLVGGLLVADGVRHFRAASAGPVAIEPVFPPALVDLDDVEPADMLAGAGLAIRHEVGRELVGPGERIEPVPAGRGMPRRRVPVALVSIAVRSMSALFVLANFLRPIARITPTYGATRARGEDLCAEIAARARVLWAETLPPVGGFSWISARRTCAPVRGPDRSVSCRPFPGVVIAT